MSKETFFIRRKRLIDSLLCAVRERRLIVSSNHFREYPTMSFTNSRRETASSPSLGSLSARTLSLALLVATTSPSLAENEQTGNESDAATSERFELSPLLVTASSSPKEASDYLTLASAVDRDALFASSAANLGEAVSNLVGVQQTGFAPGAGRPVIRGFSGPRVQLLQDGMSLIDVSATSPDHAVSDSAPLGSRIEVLRGPATLLYGGNAIGGVVNLIQESAPTALPDAPFSGEASLRYDGASLGWESALRTTVRQGNLAYRVGLAHSAFEDYRIPDFFAPEEDEHHHEDEHEDDAHEDEDEDEEHVEEAVHRLANTFSDRAHGELGVSVFTDGGGRISASFQFLEALYGIPGHHHHHEEEAEEKHEEHEHEAETSVRVDLVSRRSALGFDLPLAEAGFFQRVKADFVFTDYEHRELEGDEIGTRFQREAWELRNEWTHAPVFGYSGVLGWQFDESSFEADGEEAFTPPSETSRLGIFWTAENVGPRWTWQHGARLEYEESRVDTALPDYAGWAGSAATGFQWQWTEAVSLGTQVSLSQRHPNATELFADGPHLATGAYEIGDASIGVETALGLDLTLRGEHEHFDWTLAGYVYDFDDYLYEAPTGGEIDDLPVYAFQQSDTLVLGGEFEGTVHLWEGPRSAGHLTVGFDWTRLENTTSDQALPRNPPARLSSTFHLDQGPLGVSLSVRHTFEEDFLAPEETATDGYTMLDLRFIWKGQWGRFPLTASLGLHNLTDELAFNHLTYQKEEKPLAGRSLSLGLHCEF